jgi:hypothetical protein
VTASDPTRTSARAARPRRNTSTATLATSARSDASLIDDLRRTAVALDDHAMAFAVCALVDCGPEQSRLWYDDIAELIIDQHREMLDDLAEVPGDELALHWIGKLTELSARVAAAMNGKGRAA